eukprot:TRINITY_DN22863_c0_g1_i1.p1 TRINITY_DN22863_c0_g1~~TRINITY_DN22863_c0_g1_i1.p1  ORF type:complete len:125 (-),score=12.62 TRINITY_DN22863_c0_g1_i1:53-427(-)
MLRAAARCAGARGLARSSALWAPVSATSKVSFSSPSSEAPLHLEARRRRPTELACGHDMEADSRIVLVGAALCCFFGSILSVYVAVTHDPNNKEDRPNLKKGEYLAGASVVGACALMYITMKSR